MAGALASWTALDLRRLEGAAIALAMDWRRVAAKPPALRLITVTSFPGGEGMPSLSRSSHGGASTRPNLPTCG
jgi:hypothetical protein